MTSSDTASATASSRRAAFRPDIEGMRALAIALVLLYHAGVSQVPGGYVGVDVFFVISGFLITGLLIREIEANGRIALGRFYARRAKRLLPATGVVLAATALLTWLTITVVDWRDFGLDVVSSALYVVNWRLAARSVDYLAEDVGLSPVQHFWSLAVEEQFYIVWPLLLVALVWWLRRSAKGIGGRRLRPMLFGAILLVSVPSFLYSVYLTHQDQALAFFVTPTRLWELGVGSLLAIGTAVWPRIPRTAAAMLGWAGLATVIASALLVDSTTAWPGYAALAPTLGTAAMIVAGYTSGNAGPAGLLSTRPAVWVGGLSYSLYLWHWPLVVAAGAYWGGLTTVQGLAVVAFSFLPAYLCFRLVENPIRFAAPLARSNKRTGAVGVGFTAVGAASGLMLAAAVPATTGPPTETDAPEVTFGAPALEADSAQGTVGALADIEWFVPAPTEAEEDLPDGYADECQVGLSSPEPDACQWGDPEGEVTIAVVGDSKVLQYQSALEDIAVEHGWRIVSHTKSACGFHAGMQQREEGPYTECAEWNEAVLAEMIDLQPDLLITSQGAGTALADPQDGATESREAMVEALVTRWEELADHDIPVAVVMDNPGPPSSVHVCVAENPDELEVCAFDPEPGVDSSGAPAQRAALAQVQNATEVDMVPWICPGDPCVPVIGNVLVYRQGSHVTDTYIRSLQDRLAEELVPLVTAPE